MVKLLKKKVFKNMFNVYFSKKNLNKYKSLIKFLGLKRFLDMRFIRRLLIDFIRIERMSLFEGDDIDLYIKYRSICRSCINKKPYKKYTKYFGSLWKDVDEFIEWEGSSLIDLRLIRIPYKLDKYTITEEALDDLFSLYACYWFYQWKIQKDVIKRREIIAEKIKNARKNK